MGTNFYATQPCEAPCKHCNPPQWHICKILRTFQAHLDTPWGDLRSWQDWKAVLNSGEVVIVDEYGVEHEVKKFIADVEAVPIEQRRRQYDWVQAHRLHPSGYRDYLDDDQFSFYSGDFS